jgi:hypothetical protein
MDLKFLSEGHLLNPTVRRALRACVFASLVSTFTVPTVLASDSLRTLGDFRKKYVGQRVVVGGRLDDSRTKLDDWHIADKKALKKGRYEDNFFEDLPRTYMGRMGTVLAIQGRDSGTSIEKNEKPKQNALGETVTDDARDISLGGFGGLVRVIVRFDDGVVAINTTTSSSEALGVAGFTLASVRARQTEIIGKNLPSVVGQKLYPVGYSWVYSPDISLDDLLDIMMSEKSISNSSLPLLQPAEILVAKYIEERGMVVLKLRLADGREVLTHSRYKEEDDFRSNLEIVDGSFLSRIAGSLLPRIPETLSKEEVSAIQRQEMFRGMSRVALEYMMGRTNENDWGQGGKQLVYGALYVYLDTKDRVTDWQVIPKKY